MNLHTLMTQRVTNQSLGKCVHPDIGVRGKQQDFVADFRVNETLS